MMKKKHSLDMCSGPIAKKMIKFSIPIILSGIVQLLYNAADIVVVGRFSGKESLAAVGSTGALINLFLNLFFGLSAGVCVTLANSIGMKDDERCSRTVHTSITVAVISGIFVAMLGFILSPFMLKLMDSPDDVLEKASLYLQIYFLGIPALLLYNFGSSLLRAIGDTTRPMIILVISGIINVIFNFIFVIIFKMDVAGVAIATAISQIISAVLVIICLIRMPGCCRLSIRKMHIYKKELLSIIKIGVPAGIQGMIFSISNIQIQTALNSFGSATIAGNSAASNIEGFVYTSMNSIYQAALTFTSQNYGAHQIKRIKRILIDSILIVFTVGVIFSSVILIFATPLLKIYSSDIQILPYGLIRLKYICSTYCLCGMMEVVTALIRGLNHSLVSMIVSIVGVCGYRMVWILFVFPAVKTLDILYVSYPISWFITGVFHFICFTFIYRKYVKSSSEEPIRAD